MRELSEVSRAQGPLFCEPLHRAERHLARMLQAFQDRLNARVQCALGVSLTPHEVKLEVRKPSAPPVDVGYAFDVAFSLVGRLIPLTVFRQPIERALRRKTRWEVEKNLSRLAAAWHEQVAAAIRELVRQAEERAAGDMAALGQMLGQKRPVSLACGRQRRRSPVCATHCRRAPANRITLPTAACHNPLPHLWGFTPLFPGCRIFL